MTIKNASQCKKKVVFGRVGTNVRKKHFWQNRV
jgi:hypothetical protein